MIVDWESYSPRNSRARIDYVDAFDARGMRRVYGRGDHFGDKAAFNMDIWRDRSGRLLARFWSRNAEVDTVSLELYGVSDEMIPARSENEAFSDVWIPKVFRHEYEQWVISEF